MDLPDGSVTMTLLINYSEVCVFVCNLKLIKSFITAVSEAFVRWN